MGFKEKKYLIFFKNQQALNQAVCRGISMRILKLFMLNYKTKCRCLKKML